MKAMPKIVLVSVLSTVHAFCVGKLLYWQPLIFLFIFLQRGQTPLLLAAENDHSEVVKLFLQLKPDLVTMASSVLLTYFCFLFMP